MRKVIVTGATGFIGRHTIKPLLKRSFDVHALYHTEPLDEPRVTWHRADLADETAVAHVLEETQPSHLLHFAWIATPGVYWTSPENELWVDRTLSLVRSFREHGGKRAVLAGTCAEYDWNNLPEFIAEDAPRKPVTLYGQCKNETHERAEVYAKETGLSLAWGRIFFLFGPHEPRWRLVPSVITTLLANHPAETTIGTQVRDFLFVEDVADAFAALLDSDIESAVNIASGNAVAVKDVVMEIARIIGKPELVQLGAKKMTADEPPRLVADITRLKKGVGWIGSTPLTKGLEETIAWWKASRA